MAGAIDVTPGALIRVNRCCNLHHRCLHAPIALAGIMSGAMTFEQGYALVIGVNASARASLALPTVEKDVRALEAVLKHPQRCGYAAEHVQVLTGTEATRSNILTGLRWLGDSLATAKTANTTALVYFSGHGHRATDGKAYLLPYDVEVPLRLGALAAEDFAERIGALQARRLLVILDCCYAGAMGVKDADDVGLRPSAVTKADGFAPLDDGAARAVLSSSTGDQRSYIRSDGAMSVFTYHLIEALTGHAENADEATVTVTRVIDHVSRRVPASVLAQHGAVQEPTFDFKGTSFPIALVLGGEGVAKGATSPDPAQPLAYADLRIDVVSGEAVNLEIAEQVSGTSHAKTEAVIVTGKLTNTKIGTLGRRGGDS